VYDLGAMFFEFETDVNDFLSIVSSGTATAGVKTDQFYGVVFVKISRLIGDGWKAIPARTPVVIWLQRSLLTSDYAYFRHGLLRAW